MKVGGLGNPVGGGKNSVKKKKKLCRPTSLKKFFLLVEKSLFGNCLPQNFLELFKIFCGGKLEREKKKTCPLLTNNKKKKNFAGIGKKAYKKMGKIFPLWGKKLGKKLGFVLGPYISPPGKEKFKAKRFPAKKEFYLGTQK